MKGPEGSFDPSFDFDQFALFLFGVRLLLDMVFHPIRLSGNGHDMRMMQDPVQDRVGHNGVLKYFVPFAEADIGCQYRAFLFVSFVDQLKEQFRLFFCKRELKQRVAA